MANFGPATFSVVGVAGTGTAGGGPWSGASNTTDDDATAATWDYLNNGTTDELRYANLIGRNNIPSNAIISSISVRVRARLLADPFDWRIDCKVRLGDGPEKSIIDHPDSTGAVTATFSGDLSYWGVTNQEAVNALKAESLGDGVNVWLQFVTGQDTRDPAIEYVEVFDVEYIIPSSGVRFIAMF